MKISFSKREIEVNPEDLNLGYQSPLEGRLFLKIERGLYLGKNGIGTYSNYRLFSK